MQLASQEIELVRSQDREQIHKLQREAQSHISNLEGRMTELIHINPELSNKKRELCGLIEILTNQIDERHATNARMQSDAMRSSPIEATNGAVFAISTPVGREVSQLGTGPRVDKTVDWEQAQFAQELEGRSQGAKLPKSSVEGQAHKSMDSRRSGSSTPNNPLDSHQPVQNVIAQMKSWMETIEERLSRSPSVRSP